MPFTPDRIARVNELLKREIAGIIEHECISVPGILVSVVKVHTSSTLRNATVYVSVFGSKGIENPEERAIALLEQRRGDIQHCISKNIILKYTPVLRFAVDHNIEEGDRVLSILRDLEKNDKGMKRK